MKNYLKVDEWKIIEDGFFPEHNRVTESIFSLGNGKMGQRANFEEQYSGDSLQGSYVAGVYYPDKTRVGWWKNGYPEYFAKVINSVNWIGIDIILDQQVLDLHTMKVGNFRRELDMKTGILSRTFTIHTEDGSEIEISARRFCSVADTEIGTIEYVLRSKTYDGPLKVTPYLDFDVLNEDSNYDEKFWEEVAVDGHDTTGYVVAKTRKLDFEVAAAMEFSITSDNPIEAQYTVEKKDNYVGNTASLFLKKGKEVVIRKYVGIASNLYYGNDEILKAAKEAANRSFHREFDQLMIDHIGAWDDKWEQSDITIDGDESAQQGIRFNIFQLNQTYSGEDPRLNIGPKGFTGEKYGGSTYWDTEAYCLPFYQSTAGQEVARNLLLYRYKHLGKAIENAEKLGFKDGAALYPMVTMNGEECHNEWEITFEEIHRNGAMAYAIYDYVRYTGEEQYLEDNGLEVLIGIARFWSQRVNWSEKKQKFVMLGVTGPNEYENNVNNNWYTNYMARWCLQYTLEVMETVRSKASQKYSDLCARVSFKETEADQWKNIADNMFFPVSEENGVFLQQEGFEDKELLTVDQIPEGERPINQNWSWDRILRSCFIKQADVLQGLYFFDDHFDTETIKKNFDFYEPMTVHESSLSPCVHSILAARLGYHDKAYEMYIRTARLDLDDYNNDTEDGCHITSMAGTWMSFVMGFAGMKVSGEMLSLNPFIPDNWNSYSFHIRFRGVLLHVFVKKDGVEIKNYSKEPIKLLVSGSEVSLDPQKTELISQD